MKSNKIESSGLYLLAFLPILDYGISAFFLFIAIIINIYYNGIKLNFLWLFAIYFIYIFVISNFYSDLGLIIKRFSHSSSIFFVPLLMSSKKITEKELRIFTKVYITVVAIKLIICLVEILRDPSFVGGGTLPIINVDFHATYFSYQIIIAIILCFYIIKKPLNFWIILFFSIGIVFLQKKIALIALLVLLILSFRKLNFKEIFIITGGLVISFIVFFNTTFFTKTRTNLKSIINLNLAGPDKVRLRLNEAAFANIKEAPFFGKGIVEHFDFFSNYNMKYLGDWAVNYDTHNYFLFVLCSGGIIGLIIFIIPIFISLVKTWKNNMILFSYLAITLIFNLSESLLYRYNGAVIYAVFLMVLYSKRNKPVISEFSLVILKPLSKISTRN